MGARFQTWFTCLQTCACFEFVMVFSPERWAESLWFGSPWMHLTSVRWWSCWSPEVGEKTPKNGLQAVWPPLCSCQVVDELKHKRHKISMRSLGSWIITRLVKLPQNGSNLFCHRRWGIMCNLVSTSNTNMSPQTSFFSYVPLQKTCVTLNIWNIRLLLWCSMNAGTLQSSLCNTNAPNVSTSGWFKQKKQNTLDSCPLIRQAVTTACC